jgi:hypothetical protein
MWWGIAWALAIGAVLAIAGIGWASWFLGPTADPRAVIAIVPLAGLAVLILAGLVVGKLGVGLGGAGGIATVGGVVLVGGVAGRLSARGRRADAETLPAGEEPST